MGVVSRLLCLGDISLHYSQEGEGDPLVLVHGGGTDLTYWDDAIPHFAVRHRVIAYSRRYAEPNRNSPIDPDYSARTDGRDLAALITALELAPVHVVAHSIGGVAALFCAVGHPRLVQSLAVAEPPVLRWARGTPAGDAAWDRFLDGMWEPAAAAFRAGDMTGAMQIITDYFTGAGVFRRLRPAVQERILRNARDWQAFTTSSTPFPPLDRESVGALTVPVLMLSGERTIPIHRMVDDVLERTLARPERVQVPGASHDLWSDQPALCREATLAFLARQAT